MLKMKIYKIMRPSELKYKHETFREYHIHKLTKSCKMSRSKRGNDLYVGTKSCKMSRYKRGNDLYVGTKSCKMSRLWDII